MNGHSHWHLMLNYDDIQVILSPPIKYASAISGKDVEHFKEKEQHAHIPSEIMQFLIEYFQLNTLNSYISQTIGYE